MMRCFSALLALLCASLPAAAAPPRVAMVKVKEIYSELPATLELQERIKTQRQEIMKNPRADELRRALEEFNQIQTRLADKNNPPDEETGRNLARDYELKRQEAQTLQREFESFRTEREKEINRDMVVGMREILNRIMEISGKLAKERGFDLLFDSSGNTNTGVPFILHHKQPSDITADVKAALKDAAAASPPPASDKPADAKPAPANAKPAPARKPANAKR